MHPIGAYIIVVLVWSTTPLAIQLSNSSLSFVSAITVRIGLALAICYAALRWLKRPLFQTPSDWRVYAASGVGLFPNLLLMYWAAQFIPSGLMSVLLGIYPFFVGLLSWWWLGDNPFTPIRVAALALAVVGLALINLDQLAVGPEAAQGVAVMILSSLVGAASSVLVKKFGQQVDALRQGTGSMVFAMPGLLICWALIDGHVPDAVDPRSMWAVLYLVLVGSVLSHTLYFHVLRVFSVNTVSLMTLMTPILAITWGAWIMSEALTRWTLVGAGCILVSLALYQNVPAHFSRLLRRHPVLT